MTFTGLLKLQTAVIARLRGDGTLTGLVSGVFDAVPQSQAYPYVVFDYPSETPDRTFGQDGHDSLFTLIVYTQDGSATKTGTGAAGFKQGLTIVEQLLILLIDESNPLVVSGHDVRDLDVDSLDCFRETDGITRRVEVMFAAALEDNPLIP